jgi:hypothetical protein
MQGRQIAGESGDGMGAKVTAALTATLVCCLASCGSGQATPAERLTCSAYKAFSASGSLEGGGAPTPIDAAKAAAGNDFGFTIPDDGWVQLGSVKPSGTEVRSGDVQLTAVQLKDGTWSVFEGKTCA